MFRPISLSKKKKKKKKKKIRKMNCVLRNNPLLVLHERNILKPHMLYTGFLDIFYSLQKIA